MLESALPGCYGPALTAPARTEPELDLALLDEVQRRVLWLAASIVHHANRVRPNPSGVKVGGHQASSASMVSLMTALWFGVLEAPDRVSVKPHASPCCTRSTTCSAGSTART
jgi:pyruvate dehydrogenase E1 component